MFGFDGTASAISFIADIVSLIGFVITLLVFRKVRTLQKDILVTARVPELLDQLVKDRDLLNKLVEVYKKPYSVEIAGHKMEMREHYIGQESKHYTQSILETCRANLASLGAKLTGPAKKNAIALENEIGRFQQSILSLDELAGICGKLNGLVTYVENELKDRKWVKRD